MNRLLILQRTIMRNLLLMLVLLISTDVLAQANIRFSRIAQEHQLSQPSVNALLQDRQGFMWIGTQDGLNRYDGYQLKVYRHDPNDPASLSSNWINALYEDKEGILWVATFSGLNRFDPKSEEFSHYPFDANNPTGLSHGIVTAIIEDSEGMFWIGTRSGLNRFDRQTGVFTRYHHDSNDSNSISNDRVTAIVEDKFNRLWIGTFSGGLNLFDRNTEHFSRYRPDPDDYLIENITRVIIDRNDHFWVGTYDQGVTRMDIQNGTFEQYRARPGDKDSLSNNMVLSLMEDSQGGIWVGTGKGLSLYKPQQNCFLRLQHDQAIADSLAGNRVSSLYEDGTGIIWVGMSVGLSLFNQHTANLGYYRQDDKDQSRLNDNSVLSVSKDSTGLIWVATDGGLNRYDRDKNIFSHFDDVPMLSRGRVLSVYENSRGEHWVGTFADGLIRLDNKMSNHQQFQYDSQNPQSLSHDQVNVVIEDAQQVMWIGTNKGLNRYDSVTNTFKRYYHDPSDPNSLSNEQIISLYIDEVGTLWIGTHYGGLNRYNPQNDSFTRFKHDEENPNSISHNRINSIVEDQSHRLWIGTRNGLNLFEPGKNRFIRFGEEQGLLSNTVSGVLADAQGYLWLSSNRGLSRFDAKSHQLRHFDLHDGLQGNEFSNGAASKSADGELFFGGINGFNAFYPEKVVDNDNAPNTVVTDFMLFNRSVSLQRFKPDSVLNQPISQTKQITLSYTDTVFGFEFAAIDFANPQGIRYAYQLAGYDQDWLYTDINNRRATYTNLPDGSYEFKVKAGDKQGLWGEETSTIKVILLPAPWRTWWAYTLYSLMTAAIIGLLGYQRQQKLHERAINQQQREKNQEQLQLALWASGDQLWDIDLITNKIIRKNCLPQITYPDSDDWEFPGEGDDPTHPEDAVRMQSQITAHFEHETEFCEMTYRIRNKVGEWIWLLDRGQVVEWDGKGHPVRFSGTTKNIHHLKSTEAELLALTQSLEQRVESRTRQLSQKTQELTQSNEYLKSTQSQLVEAEKMASLGSLVAGISHEINTPVGISITALSALRDRSIRLFEKAALGKMTRTEFNGFGEQSEMALSMALESLNRASDLVENFKQIAVDRANERCCEVRLDQLIDDVITASILNSEEHTKDGITVNCPKGLTVTTYPDAFARVFCQLVQNTLVHGYLPDEFIEISVNVTRQDNDIVILYQDKGHGMGLQVLEHIFDPFYTTNRTCGTGLGMHMVYNQVCQLLKGQIRCDSQPGHGCRFTLSLPSDVSQVVADRAG